jgi:single-stranded-DNA-specific exonuclease
VTRVEKRWILRQQPTAQEVANLRSAINASDPLAKLLLQRGIQDFEAAKNYFNPSISSFHHPFLMKGMDKAVERITQAVEAGENILVYGDYDVDGTTSVALVYTFLTNHYDRVSYYIPDRYGEGYGISFQGIDFAQDNDVSLIIALDCGIKAIDQVAYANERGIDFIICDHHLPGAEVPAALAILNPLQSDCPYPYKSLSGCGIGYKLIDALTITWKLEESEPRQFLDLVAIAAGCDIVPITGENRLLCHFGLRLMEQSLRPGLAMLLENGGLYKDGQLKRPLTITDLVFVIGPRINAAGRMEHGQLAVELLTAQTTKKAEEPAARVVENNMERREVDLDMLEEALEMLEGEDPNLKSTMLFAEHWHKGVVGIVASRVQDQYYRPTIILTESNGKVSGSARSVRGFDVHAAIETCADLLENFGGHQAAAGMTLAKENLAAFKERFERAVAEKILPEQLIPSLEIDIELDFDQINARFYDSMNRMAPFGPENMRPVFVTHNVIDTGKSKCVGDGSHLKFLVSQQGNEKIKMGGIGFGLGEHMETMKSGKPFSLVYVLEINEFRGQKNLELMVKDIRFNAA